MSGDRAGLALPDHGATGLSFESSLRKVKLTARSERLRRDPFTTVLRRRFNKGMTTPRPKADLAAQHSSAPIIAVAIDLAEGHADIKYALRVTTQRILATLPSARLACLNVLKQGRLTIDTTLDETGHNKHVERMVGLKYWAEPLKLEERRLTVHDRGDRPGRRHSRIRAVEPRRSHPDRRGRNSPMRKLLGSVSAKVAAEAACTVTVVRPQYRRGRKAAFDGRAAGCGIGGLILADGPARPIAHRLVFSVVFGILKKHAYECRSSSCSCLRHRKPPAICA